MKKLLFIALLMVGMGFISCKKESVQDAQTVNLNDGKPSPVNIGMLIFSTCGDWGISKYQVNKVDLTRYYRTVGFNFCPDNSVSLYNDFLSFRGTWTFLWDKGNPSNLVLQFTNYEINPNDQRPPILTEFSGNWKVLKIEKTQLYLQDNTSLLDNTSLKTLVLVRKS